MRKINNKVDELYNEILNLKNDFQELKKESATKEIQFKDEIRMIKIEKAANKKLLEGEIDKLSKRLEDVEIIKKEHELITSKDKVFEFVKYYNHFDCQTINGVFVHYSADSGIDKDTYYFKRNGFITYFDAEILDFKDKTLVKVSNPRIEKVEK